MVETTKPDAPSPPSPRYSARYDAMVEVAADYFLEHGYAGTTMSAIAAAIGGSKATLWSYFPSKEELFAAVIDARSKDFRAGMMSTLEDQGPIQETLLKFCTEFLRKLMSAQAIGLYRLVIGEAGRFPEMGQIFYARGPQTTQKMLGKYLARAMEDGLLRDDEPTQAARYLTSLCMSYRHQRVLMGIDEQISETQIVREAESTVNFFMAGYGLKDA